MKLHHASVALIAGLSVLCTSCVVRPGDGYGTFTYSTNGYNSSVAWTNASYDANGFPIFGYSYGRPVYGYTDAGVAIFSIAALTALCFVPKWRPAPWYHGSWHYPPHIHRVAAPPRYEHGHRPHMRPHGGMNAPIHRNPASVLGKPGNRPDGRPVAGNHKPGQPVFGSMPGNNRPGGKPGFGGNHRPGQPAFGSMPGNNRPDSKPGFGGNHRPGNPSFSGMPGNNRPDGKSGFGGNHRPGNPSFGGMPGHSRPSAGGAPTGSKPDFGGHSRPSMGSMPGGRPAPSAGGPSRGGASGGGKPSFGGHGHGGGRPH